MSSLWCKLSLSQLVSLWYNLLTQVLSPRLGMSACIFLAKGLKEVLI